MVESRISPQIAIYSSHSAGKEARLESPEHEEESNKTNLQQALKMDRRSANYNLCDRMMGYMQQRNAIHKYRHTHRTTLNLQTHPTTEPKSSFFLCSIDTRSSRRTLQPCDELLDTGPFFMSCTLLSTQIRPNLEDGHSAIDPSSSDPLTLSLFPGDFV